MFGTDPFSLAAFNMAAGANPEWMAQLLGGLGIPPPQAQAGGGMELGNLLAGQSQAEGNYGAYATPPPQAQGNPMAGLAALGRGALATKSGSADVKPVFSGGITQAGKAEAPSGPKAAGNPAGLQALQALFAAKSAPAVPTLGALLAGRR